MSVLGSLIKNRPRDLFEPNANAMCLILQIVDKCLMDGADEFLQLMALCSTIMKQLCSPN